MNKQGRRGGAESQGLGWARQPITALVRQCVGRFGLRKIAWQDVSSQQSDTRAECFGMGT